MRWQTYTNVFTLLYMMQNNSQSALDLEFSQKVKRACKIEVQVKQW